ncbi:hypothetical protein JG687_00015727 [Phytophthora cactorum]|uniref:Uncharacterized protein n=1 Tax=Phytophthora cactorum TaxID=29920 RepID=A0A8T1TV50_9STRA|nr:hypothetical protein JG687_00015727 [Phytophthora cactorum]
MSILPNEKALRSDITYDDAENTFVDRVEDAGDTFSTGIDNEQENIHGDSQTWHGNSEEDESAMTLHLSWQWNTPLLQQSDQSANDVAGDLFARMFPHLFFFGHRHPGERRRVSVAVLECVKYYTMMSGCQFSEDELFSLAAFDRISLRNIYILNHFCCQRFHHLLDGYDELSADQLGRALLDNERLRQGCLPWKPATDSVSHRVLKSVKIGTGSIWGSNAERSKFRHQAFAYQTRFGQPALFLTLIAI